MFKVTRLSAIVLLLIVLTAPVAAIKYYDHLLSAAAPNSQLQRFVIKPGQPVTVIAGNLKKDNLIRNDFAFRLLVYQMGITKTIQAGDFRLSGAMSSRDIAQELTHGAIDIWITIPEGFRVEEIGEKVEAILHTADNDKYQFDKQDFIKIAEEGYMFPDTYLIPKDTTAADVAEKLKSTFEEKVDQKILSQGEKNGLTPEEVVVVASLVEREAKTDQERPVIAGILVNRLKIGLALQVDAAVQYAKGYSSAQNTWWSQVSTSDYQSVKSLYNTYLHAGLSPGPIASPGLESIRAAAGPAETDYLYYLHDREGKVHYAKTIEEHNKNIQNYL